jgi:hypothetical protein
MTDDNLLECRFGDGLDDDFDSVGIDNERLTLTVKGLQQIIDTAKAIEREEIALMLIKDSVDKNSITQRTIERLVDLIRCRPNK